MTTKMVNEINRVYNMSAATKVALMKAVTIDDSVFLKALEEAEKEAGFYPDNVRVYGRYAYLDQKNTNYGIQIIEL